MKRKGSINLLDKKIHQLSYLQKFNLYLNLFLSPDLIHQVFLYVLNVFKYYFQKFYFGRFFN